MNYLPKKFNSNHIFCIDIYNEIVSLFKEIEKNNFLSVKYMPASNENSEEFLSLQGEDLYKWLKRNKHYRELFEMDYKNCYAALLTDMLQYLLTSLQCSVKGQLNITYALLRKPLKDNLFYLEYLLADPIKFIESFNSETDQELFAVDKIAKEKKIEIIRIVLSKMKGFPYSAEELWDLRFNKKNPNGFEPAFEMANHLITTHEYYKTEDGNFNFIFSNEKNKVNQWDYFYTNFPPIMFYILLIFTELTKNIITLPTYWDLLITKYSFELAKIQAGSFSSIKSLFSGLLSEIYPTCKKCEAKIVYNSKQYNYFKKKFTIKCKKCLYDYSLYDAFIE